MKATKATKRSCTKRARTMGTISAHERGTGPDPMSLTASPGALPVERGIYTLSTLARYPEILHGISTRCSPHAGDWNLSARRGTPEHPPDPAVALANRVLLAQ